MKLSNINTYCLLFYTYTSSNQHNYIRTDYLFYSNIQTL